jgi:hypothetical protein
VFTIEHILPESTEETWGNFTFEEINRSVYRIGNYTLLEKKLNREADTKTYSVKLHFYKQSNALLTQAICENYETWNEDKLAARQRELAKHAKAIWRIQELSN